MWYGMWILTLRKTHILKAYEKNIRKNIWNLEGWQWGWRQIPNEGFYNLHRSLNWDGVITQKIEPESEKGTMILTF